MTTTKKVQDGTMYITSSRFTNLELASLGLNLYIVEKNEKGFKKQTNYYSAHRR